MPIAGDFRRFFRWIAEDDERLRPKLVRNRRHQCVEALLGQRSSVRVQTGEMHAREQWTLDRLDHVDEHEREAQRVGQPAGHHQLMA